MSPTESRKFPFAGVFLLLCLVAVSFSLTLSKNHNDAEDAVAYIQHVTEGQPVYRFHPNHLLYNSINRHFYQLWQSAGYSGNALLPMQTLNIITSLITLLIVAFIGWQLGLTQRWILLAMSLLVSCYGYWWYSVEAEAYLLPIPFALTAWYQSSRFIQSGGNLRLVIAAFCVAFAILIHQQWLALFAALGLALMLHCWKSRLLPEYRGLLITVILAAALTIGIIVMAYILIISGYYGITSTEGIVAWIRGDHEDVSLANWSYWNPVKAVIGMLRAVWGGHFVFGFPAPQDFLVQKFPDKLLVEEIFLAQSIPGFLRWSAAILSLVTAFIAGLIVFLLTGTSSTQDKRHNKEKPENKAGYKLTGLLVITVIVSLNTLVEPTNAELYVGILPIAVLLLIARLSQKKNSRLGFISLGSFALLLLSTNLVGSIIPQTNREHDYWYVANQYFFEKTTASDVIISDGGYINDAYLRLFSQAHIERSAVLSPARITELRSALNGGRMLVSSWSFEPPKALHDQLKGYDAVKAKQLFAPYRLTLVEKNAYQMIYQVE